MARKKSAWPLTWTDLRSHARKYGGTIEGGTPGKWSSYNCDAPAGHVWNVNGLHTIHVEWQYPPIPADRNAAVLDAIQRMALGVSPCHLVECDYCNPQES